MYEVYVSNIGCIENTEDKTRAQAAFVIYRRRSILGHGRAAFEDVAMFTAGEVSQEYLNAAPSPGDIADALEYAGEGLWTVGGQRAIHVTTGTSVHFSGAEYCAEYPSPHHRAVGRTPVEALKQLQAQLRATIERMTWAL